MILGKLAVATLVVSVTATPMAEPSASRQLSTHQKNVATRPYVESATNCVARAVAADSRFHKDNPANLSDLIVDSVPKCLGPMRAMIEAYDRYFGEGIGERFFTGPYLDTLPNMVVRLVAGVAD